jgi:hypothetical protein
MLRALSTAKQYAWDSTVTAHLTAVRYIIQCDEPERRLLDCKVADSSRNKDDISISLPHHTAMRSGVEGQSKELKVWQRRGSVFLEMGYPLVR